MAFIKKWSKKTRFIILNVYDYLYKALGGIPAFTLLDCKSISYVNIVNLVQQYLFRDALYVLEMKVCFIKRLSAL